MVNSLGHAMHVCTDLCTWVTLSNHLPLHTIIRCVQVLQTKTKRPARGDIDSLENISVFKYQCV